MSAPRKGLANALKKKPSSHDGEIPPMASDVRFLLDTSAFVTLTDAESGHDRVEELLVQAEKGEIQLHASFVSLTEVQYNAEYDHGKEKAREIIVHLKTLPISWQ